MEAVTDIQHVEASQVDALVSYQALEFGNNTPSLKRTNSPLFWINQTNLPTCLLGK